VAVTSSGWDRADLHPWVWESLEQQPVRPDGTPTCGCHERRSGWWLCDYHDGLQEGCEVATAALELVAALRPLVQLTELTDGEMVAFGVEVPVKLTAEQIELWDRIVDRGED